MSKPMDGAHQLAEGLRAVVRDAVREEMDRPGGRIAGIDGRLDGIDGRLDGIEKVQFRTLEVVGETLELVQGLAGGKQKKRKRSGGAAPEGLKMAAKETP